jgi:hypothetical protein
MKKEDLKGILMLHKLWIDSARQDGKRANLRHADLRHADLRHANFRHADLRDADLRHADLSGANLRDADLRGAAGNCREIKTLQTAIWTVTYTNLSMAIGCQQHSLAEWLGFSDKCISEMDSKALGFWTKWKPILIAIGVFDGVEI